MVQAWQHLGRQEVDDQFDLVIAFDVLEHIPQDEIIFFLKQVKRVLKKDEFNN